MPGHARAGAVDPINAVAGLAACEGLWHHVDGAYGGFFHKVPELRPMLAGLPRADSLTLQACIEDLAQAAAELLE